MIMIATFLRTARRAAMLSAWLGGAALAACPAARAAELKDTVAAVKRSVVAIGSYQPTRSPPIVYSGTGWVAGDGLSVITNAHVVPEAPDLARQENWGVVLADGENVRFRPATLAGRDTEHDLLHLRLTGTPLPALKLADSDTAAEGQDLAFTGYPLGMVLGLHPATHRAVLAAITPMTRPAATSRLLDARAVKQLGRPPVTVFQLDAIAYPGNSGSPLYDPATGAVYGVLNMVYVKGSKENAISTPSGIGYAVPSNHVRDLLRAASQ
ncbi:Trypsin-like peptidase domain-containing protein [Duganella sp. CF517]|nr:Trypsin-like peptidase domain-containing protein [Duganella sp. CF517]